MQRKSPKAKIYKKRAHKAGLSPGTLVHIGEKRNEIPKITVLDYDKEQFQEISHENVEKCFPYKNTETTSWINIDGVHNIELIEKLGKTYELHPLILEDIVNTGQRPKVEDYGKHLFLVMKMLYLNEDKSAIQMEQVSMVLGKNYVITFQEKPEKMFQTLKTNIRNNKNRTRKNGADFLAYSIVDTIVDQYFAVLEELGDQIETLEEQVIRNPDPNGLKTIHQLKHECLFVKKVLWPLREITRNLQKEESPLLQVSTKIYLRDAYDHTLQLMEMVETFREMLSEISNIYLSNVNNKISEAMKVLTLISTMFIPLSFIVGLYGMNFKYMPELQWKWGYPAVWGIILTVIASMFYYFKRKKWL